MSVKNFRAALNTGKETFHMSHDRKTIRNINPDVLLEAKVYALQHGITLGDLINRSLDFFMLEAEFEE